MKRRFNVLLMEIYVFLWKANLIGVCVIEIFYLLEASVLGRTLVFGSVPVGVASKFFIF